jgi:NAD(P)H dehydrogenase (quinone)
MKSLIITAHPSSRGFTHRIAQAYNAGVESVGGVAEILDLYKEPIRQNFLSFENPKDASTDPLRDSYQNRITEATDIVFIHPMWWGGAPAIMKNFIDINFSSHFAFKYVDGRPVGLLKGRTVSVYITCDGPMWIYRLIGMPFRTIWSRIFLKTCGLKVRKICVLDKKIKRTEVELEHFLEKVKSDAKKLA